MIELKNVGVITDTAIANITTIEDCPSFQIIMQLENFNADNQRKILDIVGNQGIKSVEYITFDIDFYFDEVPAYITSCISIYFLDGEIEVVRLKLAKKEWETILNNAIFPYILKFKKK